MSPAAVLAKIQKRSSILMPVSLISAAALGQQTSGMNSTSEAEVEMVDASENSARMETATENKVNNNSGSGITSISSTMISMPKKAEEATAGFVVTWKNLTYTINSPYATKDPSSKKKKGKTIFNSLTGQIRPGEVTALMGPSGCGKSTLLECIAGIRRQGRFGEVTISSTGKVRVGFVPQDDHFYELLTVREALMFASKFRNLNRGKDKAGVIVSSVAQHLNLEACENIRIDKISGGQRKRLSIAQELIASPQILILDEPTSGLDSVSSFQTVSLLNKLCAESTTSMAILATIHQPSAKLLAQFHSIYALSSIGRCVYEGSPADLLAYLQKFELEMPVFTNPSDFLIEVAAGEHGIPPLKEMALEHERLARESLFSQSLEAHHDPKSIFNSENDLEDMIARQAHPLLTHVMIHVHRSFLFTLRDLQLGGLRILAAVLVGLFMGYLYSEGSIGAAGGCPPTPNETNDPQAFAGITQRIDKEKLAVLNNLGLWFFSLIFLQFTALIPTVLVFPLEMQAFAKERTNGWYTVLSYYLGKTLSDIPFQIGCPILYCSIVYVMTDQPMEFGRFRDVCVSAIALTMVAQSHGIVFGAYFMTSVQAAMFVAPVSSIPLVVFSGFLIRIEAIPYYLTPGIYISYIRYAFDMLMIALYGQHRCGRDAVKNVAIVKERLLLFLTGLFKAGLTDNDAEDEAEEKERVTNITSSLVSGIIGQFSGKIETVNQQELTGIPAEFRLSDADYDQCLLILVGIFLFLRIIAFIVIHKKGVINK